MPAFFGFILGVYLVTIGGAYLYDASSGHLHRTA